MPGPRETDVDWQRVGVVVRAEVAERLSDALLEAGALSVDAADAAAGTPDEQPVFGEPGADATVWPETTVSALFGGDVDATAAMHAACAAIGIDAPPVSAESVGDQDWVRLTQSQFEPIRISDRLWIVPTWCEPPAPDAVVLRLDPGLAFGTGSHPTTRLCLQWLDRHLRPGERVLDYGCGSGILAVTAGLLGAGPITGVDIDPQAVSASRDNAIANGVVATFHEPDDAPIAPADVVVANILANPLRVLAPLICGLAKSGGRIVLSGILADQAESVREAYRPHVDFAAPLEDEGWVCLWGTRR